MKQNRDQLAQMQYPSFTPDVLVNHVLYYIDSKSGALESSTDSISISKPYSHKERQMITLVHKQDSTLASARCDVRTLEINGYRYVLKESQRAAMGIRGVRVLVRHCEVLSAIQI